MIFLMDSTEPFLQSTPVSFISYTLLKLPELPSIPHIRQELTS